MSKGSLDLPQQRVHLEAPGMKFSRPFRSGHLEVIPDVGYDDETRHFIRRFMRRLLVKDWPFMLLPYSAKSFHLVHAVRGLMISYEQWEIINAIAEETARRLSFKTLKWGGELYPYKFYV
jgi:hypothetical protein